MAESIPLPEGYDRIECDGFSLIASTGFLGDLKEAGLHHPDAWEPTGDRSPSAPGRGATVVILTPDRRRLVLKKLRRGGLAGRFRKDRFLGYRRLMANLTLPVELAGRGVATAEPVALLLQKRSFGLFQGWLATREIETATDASTWLDATGSSGPDLLDPVLRFVRLIHDAGLHHRDLNLGNLMVRPLPDGRVGDVAVIDLDGARLMDGSLPFRLRLLSLWRLERSMVKRFGYEGPLGTGYRRSWAAAYADGDEMMTRRILRWWKWGKVLLAVHRAGW